MQTDLHHLINFTEYLEKFRQFPYKQCGKFFPGDVTTLTRSDCQNHGKVKADHGKKNPGLDARGNLCVFSYFLCFE